MSHESSTMVLTANKALDELAEWRVDLRNKIMERLGALDPSNPNTLQYAVSAMLEAHYKLKDISLLLGPSQTTIGRWAAGQTIPRSGPYRKWLVETLLTYLHEDRHTDKNPTPPPPDVPARPERKRQHQALPRVKHA